MKGTGLFGLDERMAGPHAIKHLLDRGKIATATGGANVPVAVRVRGRRIEAQFAESPAPMLARPPGVPHQIGQEKVEDISGGHRPQIGRAVSSRKRNHEW